jgi:diguanylate cyclase (GGDEF)-like protein
MAESDDLLGRIAELEAQLEQRSEQLGAIREQLAALATIDEDTHLLNTNGLREFVRIALHRLDRHQEPFALVIIRIPELSELKNKPDYDPVVKHTATLLTSGLRALDSTARISEDTFSALLAGAKSDGIGVVIQRLRTLVTAAPITANAGDYDPRPVFCAVLVGSTDNVDADKVLETAQTELQTATNDTPSVVSL